MLQHLRPRRDDEGSAGLTALAAAVVIGLILGFFALFQFEKTDGGTISVIRNGGPFDKSDIRTVLPPSSHRTWVGWWSKTHPYPAQQRFYTITSQANAGDKSGVDVENLPTSDGVEVGVEGTVYFALTRDIPTLSTFDDKYGTRKYRVGDKYKYAWEDEEGWSAFLDQIVRPVISNDLRQEIGGVPCAELQASCALVQNGNNVQNATSAVNAAAGKSNLSIAKIQDRINASLASDFKTTLGGAFIVDVRFNLAKITLPEKVQTAINQAQAAFAAVAESQAKVRQAEADAAANLAKQKGYQNCPACVQIDMLKAIPPNVTTFAPGTGFSITQPAPATTTK